MNVLFLTMNVFTDIEMHNIYSDLMKEFIKHGHRPYIVTPRERKLGEKTELIDFPEYSLLKVQIGNTSDVSLIEKGISTITLSSRFYNAVKKKLGKIKFGLILYSTPPITLAIPVEKLKRLFKCRTYLMLKDIFPQNAVDLEMFSKTSIVCKYFRKQENRLYGISDKIGCMSQANAKYLLENNPEIYPDKVEICPNAIIPSERMNRDYAKKRIREKYCIADDAIVFLYGGNLGKPQGIPFLISCLKEMQNKNGCHFIICGNGSEYSTLNEYVQQRKPNNVTLINFLPKSEYDELAKGCDIGMIFLDHRFTIPNYPSRILSYMEQEMPVLVCCDPNTDIGVTVVEGCFGWACESNNIGSFRDCIDTIICDQDNIFNYGQKAREYLELNFQAQTAYNVIMKTDCDKSD